MIVKVTDVRFILIREGPMMRATTGDMFKEVTLIAGKAEDQVISSKDRLIDRLVDSIGGRFTDISTGVLQATRLACFKHWPQSAEEQTG